MPTRASGVAGVIGLALAATVAWQVVGWDDDGAMPPAPSASGPQATPTASPGLAAQMAPQIAPQMVQASLARPLFARDRRPHVPGATAAAAADETPLPRLTATLIYPGTRSAIFAGQPRPVVAGVGARIAGFDVQSIEPGQVTLAGPNGTRIVRTSFDGSRPVVTAAADRPLTFPDGAVPPPPIGPGSPVPGLDQAFSVPGAPQGARPGNPLGTPLGAPPGPSTSRPDAPQGAIPFEQNPSPSGLDIIKNPALQRR